MATYKLHCTSCTHEVSIDLSFREAQVCEEVVCTCGSTIPFPHIRVPGVILKGEGWVGRNLTGSSHTQPSREEQILKRIHTASMNDEDIAFVEQSNDHSLMGAMERKAEELHRDRHHLEGIYGEGAWDGTNAQGELTKILDFDRLPEQETLI